MQYLMMIYGDENAKINAPKEALDAMMKDYGVYTREMQEAGVRVAGEILHPTSEASTVRVQNGEPVTSKGPFAKTSEQLGGYYVLNCNNLDEALEWAAKCPGARFGSIEVRPIVDFSQGR